MEEGKTEEIEYIQEVENDNVIVADFEAKRIMSEWQARFNDEQVASIILLLAYYLEESSPIQVGESIKLIKNGLRPQ